MQHSPSFPPLGAFSRPLRDAMRGVNRWADAAEHAFEPAAALLPGPLRSSAKSTLQAFEDAGATLLESSLAAKDILRASLVLIDGAAALEGEIELLGQSSALSVATQADVVATLDEPAQCLRGPSDHL
ncbi:MAG: hypothetical protein AAFY65_13500 [Pseudomonadota bacterium]